MPAFLLSSLHHTIPAPHPFATLRVPRIIHMDIPDIIFVSSSWPFGLFHWTRHDHQHDHHHTHHSHHSYHTTPTICMTIIPHLTMIAIGERRPNVHVLCRSPNSPSPCWGNGAPKIDGEQKAIQIIVIASRIPPRHFEAGRLGGLC